MVYRTLLKAIQKMLNSLTLRQQHFLYQRKNLYLPILGRIFSGEPDPEDTHRQLARWSLSFYPAISPRTLSGVAERGPGASLRLRKYREDGGGGLKIKKCNIKRHWDSLTSAGERRNTWDITCLLKPWTPGTLSERQWVMCREFMVLTDRLYP